MSSEVVVGNAQAEGAARRGWFMGHFMTPPTDPRCSETVELKWGLHPQGDRRTDWTTNTRVTTISILIQGRFRLEFPDRQVILSHPGDYALWLPGTEHCWEAEAASTILTVRFPSQP